MFFLLLSLIEPNILLDDFIEWYNNAAEVLHKPRIKTRKSMETANITYISWTQPILNHMNFLFINLYSLHTHNKTQKYKFLCAKSALVEVSIYIFLLLKHIQNNPQINYMVI